jgi:amino-acid N-acetyltransferase
MRASSCIIPVFLSHLVTGTPGVNVRAAVPGDARDIKALIDLYVPDGTLLPRSLEFIREHCADFLIVAERDRILGCVHLDEYAPSLSEIRSLAVAPDAQGRGVGIALVRAAEELAAQRHVHTIFAVSDSERYFLARGFVARHIPELDRERSEVSKYKGVYAKDLAVR